MKWQLMINNPIIRKYFGYVIQCSVQRLCGPLFCLSWRCSHEKILLMTLSWASFLTEVLDDFSIFKMQNIPKHQSSWFILLFGSVVNCLCLCSYSGGNLHLPDTAKYCPLDGKAIVFLGKNGNFCKSCCGAKWHRSQNMAAQTTFSSNLTRNV